jgi:hypothetical protein
MDMKEQFERAMERHAETMQLAAEHLAPAEIGKAALRLMGRGVDITPDALIAEIREMAGGRRDPCYAAAEKAILAARPEKP